MEITKSSVASKILTRLKVSNGKKELTNEEYISLEGEGFDEREDITPIVDEMFEKLDEDIQDCDCLIDLLFDYFEILDTYDLDRIVDQVHKYGISYIEEGCYSVKICHCSLDLHAYEREELEEQYDCCFQDDVEKIFKNNETMIHHTKKLWVDIEQERIENIIEFETYGSWQIIVRS